MAAVGVGLLQGKIMMVPGWLHILAIMSLAIAGLCALIITADEFRRPQNMWIMNVVWPIIALYFGPAGL